MQIKLTSPRACGILVPVHGSVGMLAQLRTIYVLVMLRRGAGFLSLEYPLPVSLSDPTPL